MIHHENFLRQFLLGKLDEEDHQRLEQEILGDEVPFRAGRVDRW